MMPLSCAARSSARIWPVNRLPSKPTTRYSSGPSVMLLFLSSSLPRRLCLVADHLSHDQGPSFYQSFRRQITINGVNLMLTSGESCAYKVKSSLHSRAVASIVRRGVKGMHQTYYLR